MKLSADQTNRLLGKVAGKFEVGCTTFEYAKTFEFHVGKAKRYASAYQKLHPGSYVTVIEVKKKVHEFHVKRAV